MSHPSRNPCDPRGCVWCSHGGLLLSALVAGGVLPTRLTCVVSTPAPGQAPSAVLHICSPCPRKVSLGLLLRMFYLFGERGSPGTGSLPGIFLLLCLTFTATWQFLLTSCGLELQMALFPQGRMEFAFACVLLIAFG